MRSIAEFLPPLLPLLTRFFTLFLVGFPPRLSASSSSPAAVMFFEGFLPGGLTPVVEDLLSSLLLLFGELTPEVQLFLTCLLLGFPIEGRAGALPSPPYRLLRNRLSSLEVELDEESLELDGVIRSFFPRLAYALASLSNCYTSASSCRLFSGSVFLLLTLGRALTSGEFEAFH